MGEAERGGRGSEGVVEVNGSAGKGGEVGLGCGKGKDVSVNLSHPL